MTNIQDIIAERKKLEQQLQFALATLNRKDSVFKIREQIKNNQERCPHFSTEYNLEIVNNICPYCGKDLIKE